MEIAEGSGTASISLRAGKIMAQPLLRGGLTGVGSAQERVCGWNLGDTG